MTKKIVFEPQELADVYALKTIYDYLKESEFERRKEVEIYFRTSGKNTLSSIFKGCNLNERSCELGTSLYVQTYCDFKHKEHDAKNLLIDIAILKNCALPMSKEEKNKAREALGVRTELPILVISYAKNNNTFFVDKLINENKDFSEIYIIDGPYQGDMGNNVHLINIWGMLRGYYAIADVAVNGANLFESSKFIHNFVEATEGGPLFMVPPEEKYRRQFGYKELSDLEVIRNMERSKDLTAKISRYLNRPIEQIRKEKEEHCNRRAEHIMQTRKKYLPIIESEIEKMLNNESSMSGELWIRNEGNGRIIQHPDSWWK